MAAADPTQHMWWLVSRASGIVALGLISASVTLGLTMATKILRRPRIGRKLARLHEHLALVGLAAITVHGLSLLGDRWLNPGVGGITVPFTMGYRPLFTGLGIIAGYLAALLGLSFYVRRTIGARLWRKLHRTTILVWILGVIHTLGAGTDATTSWLRLMMITTGAPIVFLALIRILPNRGRGARRATPPNHARRTGPARTVDVGPPALRAAATLAADRRRAGQRAPAAIAQEPS
jgi:sulfoxide reductase heme-binding subunit YedZ